MTPPVCIPCQVEYRTVRVDVGLLYMTTVGPGQIHGADVFECPGCGHQLVCASSREPLIRHYQDGFLRVEANYSARKKLLRAWRSPAERDKSRSPEEARR